MTSHTGRLYALAFGLVVFFLAWALVAARPWSTASADPQLKALAAREVRLRSEARLVNQVVAQRSTLYRHELRMRNAQIASARARAARLASSSAAAASASASPAVRVVTLPPLTITRTS
jgi:hypothetical protein